MDRRVLGLVVCLLGAGCGSDRGSGSSVSTQSSDAQSAPTTTSAPAPNDTNSGSGSGSGSGGVTVNNTNVNTNTSGSSSSSGSSSNSGSSAGAQAGAGAAAGASSSSSSTGSGAGPARFALTTACEGPGRDLDRVRLEVHAVVLFWAGYDADAVRDGMRCRTGATVTVVSGNGSVQESPSVLTLPDVQTVTFDFAHPEVTTTVQSITTDHLGTPQIVWVLARAFVHHVGAAQDREAHGELTCVTDDGQRFAVLRMAPPVDLRGGHLSTAGFHLRSDDVVERAVSCAMTAQPRPPECDDPPEAFEPTDARISYSIVSGFASTATEQ